MALVVLVMAGVWQWKLDFELGSGAHLVAAHPCQVSLKQLV
jgi:hypothetical protein